MHKKQLSIQIVLVCIKKNLKAVPQAWTYIASKKRSLQSNHTKLDVGVDFSRRIYILIN